MSNSPLTDDEFNQLAREGFLALPPERDNVVIADYLVKERGWRNVWTIRYPEEDAGGARIEINVKFR